MPGKKATDSFKDAPPEGEQMGLGLPPSTYRLNSDIAVVAERLMTNYPERLGHLRNFRIAFLRRDTQRSDPAETFGVDRMGGVRKRSELERGIYAGMDIAVWFMATWWDRFSPEQRTAWVDHQLCHIQMTPKGLPVIVPHDVDEFATIARIYGQWDEQMVLFAESLDAYQPGGPKPGMTIRQVSATPPPPTTSVN